MKRSWLILWVLGGCLLMGSALGRPVDLSAPSAQVGSAGLYGDLQLWRDVDGVGLNMGPGSYLPLRFRFSTAPNTGGMMGPGFSVPMFEAKNILVREQLMEAFLPCGKRLYLRRDTVEPTKFQSPDSEWTGLSDGEDFVIWRDDGWKVTYHQNRLTSIQTDNNHTFDWSYNDQGVATGVSEDGQPVIGVETDLNGKLSAFDFGGKRYPVSFADRPSMEVVNGQTLVGKIISSMSAFHYPEGRTETFKVTLAPPDLVPTLDFTDRDKAETTYTWDAATGNITGEKGSEGTWTYKVGEIAQKDGVPPITRTNDKNQTEGMALDNSTGTYTATNLDGSTVVTRTFRTPGPLYGKVHKVERTLNGETSTIYQASYDAAGRLVKRMLKNGFTYLYQYDQNGKFIKRVCLAPTDPKIISKLKLKESAIASEINKAMNSEDKDEQLEQLAFLYIHAFGDPLKAMSLLGKMKSSQLIFNVKLHAIDGDDNLSCEQKVRSFQDLIKDYPGQQNLLKRLIQARIIDDLHLQAKLNNQVLTQ